VGAAIDLIAPVLLHGVLAALVAESLVHWLPVTVPAARLAYRLSALAAPLLLAPLFAWLLPFRHEAWFEDVSVFVSARWDDVRVGPIGARTLAVGAAAVTGLILLARDLGHAASDAWIGRRRERRLAAGAAAPSVQPLLAQLASAMGVAPPRLVVVDSPAFALHCRDWRRPQIIVSTSTIAALDGPRLQTAFAHELAHVAQRDVIWGWIVLLLRATQWFNPLAQAIGRHAIRDIEWRADDRAVAATAAPLALASALVEYARRSGDRFLGLSGRGRLRAIEQRCRRLTANAGPPAWVRASDLLPFWVGLTILLVFVR
jgi:Zn-dependent protease with chaperone function